jgi:hypothetical protein
MQSTIPVQSQQESKANARNLALGVSLGLLATSIDALYTVYVGWGLGRAIATAGSSVINSERHLERIHGRDFVGKDGRADGTLGCRNQQRS